MAKIMPAHVPVHIEPEKAAETEHVTEQATASHVPVDSAPVAPAAPYVDTYVARSVKSSPNGF